jgi:gas vesicle protein
MTAESLLVGVLVGVVVALALLLLADARNRRRGYRSDASQREEEQ